MIEKKEFMKTYLQQVKESSIILNQDTLDNFIDFWHNSSETRNYALHEAIGITWQEYKENILKTQEFLQLLKEKVHDT